MNCWLCKVFDRKSWRKLWRMFNKESWRLFNKESWTLTVYKKWQRQILTLLMINISNIHLILCFKFALILAETYS